MRIRKSAGIFGAYHLYGDVLKSAGKVVIGSNVFVGARSAILKGVTIGNNVIIGRGKFFSDEGLRKT